MLSEILDTRVMVKNRMKSDKDDKILQQKLNSWQLALKLTANVTYGYTSASFSGRMPCVEIADSIVQSGKETLEKACWSKAIMSSRTNPFRQYPSFIQKNGGGQRWFTVTRIVCLSI